MLPGRRAEVTAAGVADTLATASTRALAVTLRGATRDLHTAAPP